MAAPGPRNLITDVPGILVGQAEDTAGCTGTTVVLETNTTFIPASTLGPASATGLPSAGPFMPCRKEAEVSSLVGAPRYGYRG